MKPGSIRFPTWELNRRPITGCMLLLFKARYPVLLQTRHPRPMPGNQGRKSFLWSSWREVITQDYFCVYYHIVMMISIWETVLCQVVVPSTNIKNQPFIRLVFFRLLPRVYADSCGFLRTSRFQETPQIRSIFLSLPHYSLYPYLSCKFEVHKFYFFR